MSRTRIVRTRAQALLPLIAVGLTSAVGMLFVASRSEAAPAVLTICVEQAPGAVRGPALTKSVQVAAQDLPASYSRARDVARAAGGEWSDGITTPSVAAGCPDGFIAPDPDRLALRISVKAKPVAEPTRNNIKVFVVADDSSLIPPGVDYLRLPYEMSCDEGNHVCAEVSTALYVRERGAANLATMVKALEEAAGYSNLLR